MKERKHTAATAMQIRGATLKASSTEATAPRKVTPRSIPFEAESQKRVGANHSPWAMPNARCTSVR